MNVRIVQLLCPSRHCVVATAYESEDGEPIPEFTDRLRASFEARVVKELNPWCGLCRSTALTYEDEPTVFRTMAEALPFLQASSDEMATVREYLRASRS